MSANPFKATPQSTAMYRVGGRTYPLKTSKNCKVCINPMRSAIENALISGYSYGQIKKGLPDDIDLTQINIRDHFDRGHLPYQEDIRRRMIEKRAAELNYDVEAEATSLVDSIGFLRNGLAQVVERMATREIEPDVKDGIQMAKILATLDIDQRTESDLAEYATAMRDMFEAARSTMTPIQFGEYSQRVLQSTAMRSLMGKPVDTSVPDLVAIEALDAEEIDY